MQTLWSYQCIQQTGPLKSLTTPEREPDKKKKLLMKLNVQNEVCYPLFKVGCLGCLQVNTMHYIPHHFLDKREWLKKLLYIEFSWFARITWVHVVPHLGKEATQTSSSLTSKGMNTFTYNGSVSLVCQLSLWVGQLVLQDSCKDSVSLRTIWFVAVKLPQTHKQPFPVV